MSFRQKALAAYDGSELSKQDRARKGRLIQEIAFFASRIDTDVVVDDNPFSIDGITFYAYEDDVIGDLVSYHVIASRRCQACQGYIKEVVLTRLKDGPKDPAEMVTDSMAAPQFGRWLREPHLCEFELEQRKPVKGFA